MAKKNYLKVLSSVIASAMLVTTMSPAFPLNASAAEMTKVDISGGTFSESTPYNGYGGKAWDGDLNSQWAAYGKGECWLGAAFEAPISFNCVKVYETTTYGERMISVDVQTSETGEDNTWTSVKKFESLQNGVYNEVLTLDETLETSHVKLVIDGGSKEINVNEVEFYNRGEETAREKLGKLITKAEGVDTRLYKIQTVAAFREALVSAKTVYNNENMLDGQINDAAKILTEAMAALEGNELGENLATGAEASANSTYEGSYDQDSYGAEFTVDGNLGTRWASKEEKSSFEFEIKLNLGQPKTFNQLILFETVAYAGRIKEIDVQVSDDGEMWEDWRMDVEHVPAASSIVGTEVTKQYVRVAMTGRGAGQNVDEIGIYLDAEAIETTPLTPKRPIDPSWHKPIPAETANTYQLRKQEMGYGMFIHFGVNTFTGNEWGNGAENPSVYNPDPATFNPEEWAKTAWEAGMNYVVLITKHHDGFALFDTKYSDHNVTNCSHEGVDYDVVKAVADACNKYGIKLGLYYSIWDMNWERNHPKSDFVDERAWDQAYTDFAYNQIEELMTNYGEICELWIDGGWQKETERWEYERIYNMVKEHQPGCQMSVNLTIGDKKIPSLTGGEEIINFPSDFRLYDGQDTAENDPKLYTYKDETYYLPFEGTFILGNGWFWHPGDAGGLRVNADGIKNWYEKYRRQDNTLVLNVPPSTSGPQAEYEVALINEAAQKLGIARGNAKLDKAGSCEVEVRHVTTTGAIAASTEYVYGNAGDVYTTSVMNKMAELGYRLTETPQQADGVFGEDKIVVEYVYEDIMTSEEAYYHVNVDGYLDNYYTYNTKLSVTASAPEDGKKFAGWEVNGKLVSTNETYTFYVGSDLTVKAVYTEAEAEQNMESQAILQDVSVTKRDDGRYDIRYLAQLVIPEGCELKNAGLVWSNKGLDTEGALQVPNAGNGVKVTKISAISNTYQFSVTIKGVPEGTEVPGRIFAEIKDGAGEGYIYSEILKPVA